MLLLIKVFDLEIIIDNSGPRSLNSEKIDNRFYFYLKRRENKGEEKNQTEITTLSGVSSYERAFLVYSKFIFWHTDDSHVLTLKIKLVNNE